MKYMLSVISYIFFDHPLRYVKIYVVYLQALSVVLQPIMTFYVCTSTTNYSDTRTHTFWKNGDTHVNSNKCGDSVVSWSHMDL